MNRCSDAGGASGSLPCAALGLLRAAVYAEERRHSRRHATARRVRRGRRTERDELPITIQRVLLPDGGVAVPAGGGCYGVTAPDGATSRMHVSEFPE